MFRSATFSGCARLLLASAGAASFTLSAQAQSFADLVVSYDPGIGATRTDSSAALGSPDDLTGEVLGFANVLGAFSPAFEADEIVNFGAGGQITLRLANFVEVGPGLDLGVITNVGLGASNFTDPGTTNPATAFGTDSADVEVSFDGVSWVSVGRNLFDVPAVYYVNVGAFDGAAPANPVLSDFGKPFAGGLSSFDNLPNNAAVVNVLDGSGGGTWLDLSGTGLSEVGYIRFSNPDANALFELDAVVIANGKVGDPVPEPASALLVLGVGAVTSRRRRNTSGALL